MARLSDVNLVIGLSMSIPYNPSIFFVITLHIVETHDIFDKIFKVTSSGQAAFGGLSKNK